MIEAAYRIDQRDILAEEIRELVRRLGQGIVDGVAYDTAWIARLAQHYPGKGFEASLEWLRRHQYEDGTWGGQLVHYHDRFISTLAAIVALREGGKDSRDERRVKRGEDALWKLVGKLGRDDSDTVGFPVLAAGLAAEATRLGLDVPRPPMRFAEPFQKKVKALLEQSARNWRKSSLSFSLESLRQHVGEDDIVLEPNSSVGVSPSATVGYLMTRQDENALKYVSKYLDEKNALPAVAPVDTFEIAWSINYLKGAGSIGPDAPEVRRVLDVLWKAWSPESGVGYSSCLSLPNVDDTAASFNALRWGGYPVQPTVFEHFELDDHFQCFPYETNPSVSAHVRLLRVLKSCQDYSGYERWVGKIMTLLYQSDDNGSFWWDKWHSSPYYVNSAALSALQGFDDDLVSSRLKWILRTQNDDGGWGYLGESTPEETAYCLDALLMWDRTRDRIDPVLLDTAAQYLYNHLNDEQHTPLWIGKSLYTPHYVVKALILSTLFQYSN